MKAEDLKELLGLLADLRKADEQFRPLVNEGLKLLLSYSEEMKTLIYAVADGHVNLRKRVFQRLQEESIFTREEAFQLTLKMTENMLPKGNK